MPWLRANWISDSSSRDQRETRRKDSKRWIPQPFLKTVAKLARCSAKREDLCRQLNRSRLSKERRAELEHKKAGLTQKTYRLLIDLKLSAYRIDEMTQSLKQSADQVAPLSSVYRNHQRQARRNFLSNSARSKKKLASRRIRSKITSGAFVKAKGSSTSEKGNSSKPTFGWWSAWRKNMLTGA